MKTLASFRPRFSVLLLALVAGGFSPAIAGNPFNVASWYAGGEADASPTNGGDVVTAVDSQLSAYNMTVGAGTPAWDSSSVAPAANLQAASALSGFGGTSSFSYSFDGSSYLSTNLNSTMATANFGIEAWVNPASSSAAYQNIFYNGNPDTNGYGLQIVLNNSGVDSGESTYQVVLGGDLQIDTQVVVTPGAWTEFAYVNLGGDIDVYLDGALIAAASGSATPFAPSGGMSLGGDPYDGGEFTGQIDEARLFYFAPGAFNAAMDLNYVTAVPEPGTWGLLGGLGALGLVIIKKRK